MATVSFELKEPKAEVPAAIRILFNPQNGERRIKIQTGNKILPEYWSAGNVQRAITKARGMTEEVKRANELINISNERMSKRLLEYWDECRAKGYYPSNDELRDCQKN